LFIVPFQFRCSGTFQCQPDSVIRHFFKPAFVRFAQQAGNNALRDVPHVYLYGITLILWITLPVKWGKIISAIPYNLYKKTRLPGCKNPQVAEIKII
jgi:hypothetical protein